MTTNDRYIVVIIMHYSSSDFKMFLSYVTDDEEII